MFPWSQQGFVQSLSQFSLFSQAHQNTQLTMSHAFSVHILDVILYITFVVFATMNQTYGE